MHLKLAQCTEWQFHELKCRSKASKVTKLLFAYVKFREDKEYAIVETRDINKLVSRDPRTQQTGRGGGGGAYRTMVFSLM